MYKPTSALTSNLQILEAEYEDLTTILNLQKECYLSEAKIYDDYTIPPLTQTLDSIQQEFKKGTKFIKGVVDEKIVASVRGYSNNETTYIGGLIVQEEFQNRRYGQILMNKIEEMHKSCSRYELFTGHRSERNIYLYEKLGYKELKREFISNKLTLVFLEKINTITS